MPDPDSLPSIERLQARIDRERRAREEAEQVAMQALERALRHQDVLQGQAEVLSAALADSKRAENLRRRLVDSVAHVLRTPLTSLMLQLHTLERMATGDMQGVAAGIMGSARRLNGLVNDLVRLGQLQAGLVASDMAPVRLSPFLASDDRLSVGPLEGNDDEVIADTSQLKEIIDAIWHVEGQPERIDVKIEQLDDAIQVVICPVGTNATSTEELEAMGLGTYVAEGLAEVMQGSIRRDDSLGRAVWKLRLLPAHRAVDPDASPLDGS